LRGFGDCRFQNVDLRLKGSRAGRAHRSCGDLSAIEIPQSPIVSGYPRCFSAGGVTPAKVRNTPQAPRAPNQSVGATAYSTATTRRQVKFCGLPLRWVPNLRGHTCVRVSDRGVGTAARC